MARGTLRVRIIGDASNLQRVLSSSTGSLQKFATRGLIALGAAAATGVGASIRAFANFDQAMTRSTAIMGDLSDTMRNDMAAAAREVARTTSFSATEAAESFFFLASAGMDAAASIQALPKVAEFAQAGQFDMARATDLLTDAQSALGLAVDDTAANIANLTRVSDVLVRANTLANASVEQFSEALTNKAGAALRVMNKDVEEGVAVLAFLADQGLKGAAAGEALNVALRDITRAAARNQDAFRRLGLQVLDTDGNLRNMADVTAEFEHVMGGMSDAQQAATLENLGLTRSVGNVIRQLMGGSDAIRDYHAQLRNAAGFTGDVASNQMETFWQQLGLVRSQLVDVGLSVGSALMPALMGFTDWVSARLPGVTSNIEGVAGRFISFFDEAQSAADDHLVHLAGWEDGNIETLRSLAEHYAKFPDEVAANLTAQELAAVHTFMANEGETSAEAFATALGEALADLWKQTMSPWLTDTVGPWFVQELIPNLVEHALNAGGAIGDGIIKGFGNWLYNNAPPFLRRAIDDFQTHLDTNGNLLSRAANSRFFDVGQATSEGLIRGIEAGAPSVEEHIRRDFGSRAVEALNDELGVGSPARAFIPIGQAIPEGVAVGIERGQSTAIRAAEQMARASLRAAQRELGIASPSKEADARIGVPIAQGVAGGMIRELDRQADAIARAHLGLLNTPAGATVGGPTLHQPSAAGRTLTVHLPDGRSATGNITGQELIRLITEYERQNGPAPIGGGTR